MLTNKNLPKQFQSGHSLRTDVHYDEKLDDYLVCLTVEEDGSSVATKVLPISSLVYWYPLYFHYTWRTNKRNNQVVLKTLRSAPEMTKEWYSRRKPLTLEQLLGVSIDTDDDNKDYSKIISPEDYKNQGDNLILQDNLTLTTQFASMGLVTWLTLDEVNRKTYERNSNILNSVINDIHDNCLRRYREATQDKPLVGVKFINDDQGVTKDSLDSVIYQYATNYEVTLLMQAGCAYSMNNILRKVVKAKEGK